MGRGIRREGRRVPFDALTISGLDDPAFGESIAGVAGGMIVSRGVGRSGLRIRASCDPEVYLCVIRAG